jgi:hypothetical protein
MFRSEKCPETIGTRWVKTLVHAGISVESAENAFRLRFGSPDSIDTDVDPLIDAQRFIETHPVVKEPRYL